MGYPSYAVQSNRIKSGCQGPTYHDERRQFEFAPTVLLIDGVQRVLKFQRTITIQNAVYHFVSGVCFDTRIKHYIAIVKAGNGFDQINDSEITYVPEVNFTKRLYPVVLFYVSSHRLAAIEQFDLCCDQGGGSSVGAHSSRPPVETAGTSRSHVETAGTSPPPVETAGTSRPPVETAGTWPPPVETAGTWRPPAETADTSRSHVETAGTSPPPVSPAAYDSVEEDEEAVLSSDLEDFEGANCLPPVLTSAPTRQSPSSVARPLITTQADGSRRGNRIPPPSRPKPHSTNCVNFTLDDALEHLNLPQADAVTCSTVPSQVRSNGVYIVCTDRLPLFLDIYEDSMGTWRDGGRKRYACKMVGAIWKRCSKDGATTSMNVIHYQLQSNKDIHKSIYYLRRDANPVDHSVNGRVVVRYVFEHGATFHTAAQHGNSKSGKPYTRRKASVRAGVAKALVGRSAKEAVAAQNRSVGGVTNAPSLADLANHQMARHMMRTARVADRPCHGNGDVDDLLCAVKNPPLKDVIWATNFVPELTVVIGHLKMAKEMLRCSSDPEMCGPVVIDPTYKFGSFYVTPMTFTHQILLSRQYDRAAHFMSIIMIHFRRSEEDYRAMLAAVCDKVPLDRVVSFGTDGEPALMSALQHVAPNAIMLRCFRHFATNLKEFCRSMNIANSVQQQILCEVFGYDPVPKASDARFAPAIEDALLSAASEEVFEERFERVCRYCRAIGVELARFLAERKDILKMNMSAYVRTDAGLGTPPMPFTTNAAENSNSKLRRWANRQRKSLTAFCLSANDLLRADWEEIKLAYGLLGDTWVPKQSFIAPIQELLAGQNYMSLRAEERREFLERVLTPSVSELLFASEFGSSDRALSVPLQSFSVTVPPMALQNMYREAIKLDEQSDVAIKNAPGRQIFSVSAVTPSQVRGSRRVNEEVSVGRSSQIKCTCTTYRIHCMCSHALAVAEHVSSLRPFLDWHRRTVSRSLQRVVDSSTDERRRGEKGHTPKRKQGPKKRRQPSPSD